MFLYLVLSVVVSGLIIGALGRLAVPGPDPMSLPRTILVGIGGSLIGGIAGWLIWGSEARAAHLGAIAVLEVLGAALIVYLMRGRRRPV